MKIDKWIIIPSALVIVVAVLVASFVIIYPRYPKGEKLDISKFTLTFEDDFEGELNRNTWSGHYQYGS